MNEPSVIGSTQLALLPGAAEDGTSPIGGGEFQAFGEDGFTFLDFLDIINPLQHIPVVSTIYRDLTGDTLDHGSRVVGGTLFGGPIGALVSVVNVLFEETTGKDMGEHMMALFADDTPDDDGTMTAEAIPEADFETGAGGTMSEPEAVFAWTSVRPVPVKELALAPLPPSTPIDPPQPIAPPAHAKGDQPPSNRSFLAEDAVSGPATQGGSANPPLPIRESLLPIRESLRPSAENQGVQPSDTMAALLRVSEKEADAFAAIRPRMASATPQSTENAQAKADVAAQPPPGAVAPLGGWFSEVMLSALAKYRDSAELAHTTIPTVSLTN
jgi:hypothetical protein